MTAGGTIAAPALPAGTNPYSSVYLHHDQLGSIVAMTNTAGVVVERLAYDPWGKRRFINGTADTLDAITSVNIDRGFTMHEHIDEMGIINMNGRIYDPLIGRFMSADPTIPHPFMLKSFNRYSYVLNNPLRLTDPTGFDDGDGSDGTGWDGYSNTAVTTTTNSSGQTVTTTVTNVNGTEPGGSTTTTIVNGVTTTAPSTPANMPIPPSSAATKNPSPAAVAPPSSVTPPADGLILVACSRCIGLGFTTPPPVAIDPRFEIPIYTPPLSFPSLSDAALDGLRIVFPGLSLVLNVNPTVTVPGTLVGDQNDPRAGLTKNGKRHTSGTLTPDNGGTGNIEQDFDKLTGGVSSPAGGTYGPEDRKGANGIVIRPKPGGGGSIDIPSKGSKPAETLHYP
jgi:RHS repeat-associated protein